jgi:hypothetical protein
MCDYGNPDYVYCDGTQFTVTLVKKMAALQEFFTLNNYTDCPEDPVRENFFDQYNEMNSVTELVAEGTFGVEDISISVINDKAVATVTVNNKTGETLDSIVSAVWKGEGEPQNTQERRDFPTGQSTVEFEADVDKWDDVYFFSAVTSGDKANSRVVTRAFVNLPPNLDCWAQPTTRMIGGVPSVMYYLSEEENIQWTTRIPNASTLFSHINFGSYLMRENYSNELFKDVADYYLNQAFEIVDDDEKRILEKIGNGEMNIVKRFSDQISFEAGLYDVWLNIDFEEEFDLLDDGTSLETSLLLIRVPTDINPLYKIPFNGRIGENGRTNYGAVYDNTGNSDLKITNSVETKQNATGNGVVNVTTNIDNSFYRLNSSVGTRGQLATINHTGAEASILFTPNYATPVIGRYTLEGTSGRFSFEVEESFTTTATGGNLSYWTGAARSGDFFGGSASEFYNNTPDSQIDDKYGFKWTDVSHAGTIYLKSVFYTPVNNVYMLKTSDGAFWTPNNNFSGAIELAGIGGMRKNQSGDYFETLQDLLDMVRNQDVCISNDGSTMSFWWNPRAISQTVGNNNSLLQQEQLLSGN